MSYPQPENEVERLEVLHSVDILDTAPEASFDRITRHVARIFQAPMAVVSFIDCDRVWFKSRIGVTGSETPRDVAFCAHGIVHDGVMVVPDTHQDDRFRANPLVTGPLGIRFYAGAPIRIGNGLNLGMLCFMDTLPRPDLTDHDKATLADLAEVIADALQIRIAVKDLEKTETVLAESEQRYRSVVDNVKEVIFQTDAEGRWTFLNRAWHEITGFSAAESLGKHFLDFVHPEDRERNMELFVPLIERKKSYCRHEIRYITKNGGFRWIDVYARLTLDDDGAILGASGTLNDVTDWKNGEEELRQAKEAAERASKAKDEFLSRVSHELRTPLNTILGFAQLLDMDAATPTQQQNTARILRAGRHLLGLVNEVLDISRIESGRLALELESVSCEDVMTSALEMIRPLMDAKDIKLVHHGINGGGRHVHADRQRLVQVLLNLLSNAVKYNRQGGEVSLSYELVGTDQLRIKVADTGIGIATELVGMLFEPFQRLGAERSSVEGTGLGLALSRGLAERMNGRIGVESVLGEGSTFWVDLPVFHAVTSERSGPSCEGGVDHSSTILYIEDNATYTILVAGILKHRPKVRLITATHGTLGLEMARRHLPDLILLDLYLLDSSGLEVLKQLQQDDATSSIPVVIITSDATPGTEQRLLAAGARNYLTKPLDVQQFLATIDQFVEREVMR